jgi:hypothetical protein
LIGESFIRTTGRVSVNFAVFDMILTTQHLILVDNTYARFEPQMIPVLNILAVTAGKVATGSTISATAMLVGLWKVSTTTLNSSFSGPHNVFEYQQPVLQGYWWSGSRRP